MSKRTLTTLLLSAIAAVLLVGACGEAGMAQQRALWQRQGLRSYRYELRQLCFGCQGVNVRIEVRDGVVVDARDAETGEPYEHAIARPKTIEELFDLLENAAGRGADEIEVTYDRTYGYPTQASIDYIREAVDDEYGFQARALTPL